ncbi:HAD family hydrolase [Caldalkalibacillus salinus]|uniref:HAD family hydrolase n=1 Tax=Caldalkalibacillus salinus TaxID=2803787 RepID=UPI001922D50E|nr:HAD family hydrolase [Caldalkalibacillus salinus]
MSYDQAYFFDLDDTLYDQLRPFVVAIEKTNINIDTPYSQLFHDVRRASDRLWEAYENKKMSLEELRVQRLIHAFHKHGYELSVKQAQDIQDRYEEQQGLISLFEGAMTCLQVLVKRHQCVGLITNGPVAHQMRKIRTLKLDTIIPPSQIFISDAIGIAKPDPRIFEYVQDALRLSADRCVYVGDTWANDVEPALKAGWTSIWYNHRRRETESAYRPHDTIYDFEALRSKLEAEQEV